MFLTVTIRTNQFQVLKIAIFSIPVLVMHMEYFSLAVTASFTLRSSRLDKSHFQGSLRYYLVSRPIYFILNALSVRIGAAPAAGNSM